ncbi:MAG: TMEM165/GDT1 family protein [Chloroflexia bacterium]
MTTFGVLFLAELGDKTQLAVITQVCRYRRPLMVFCGAALALTLVTALGAGVGHLVARFIPAVWMRRLAALGFLAMGVLLLREAWRAGRVAQAECAPNGAGEAAEASPWRAFATTFGLLSLAEMGDKTQLAVLARASETGQPLTVFAGASLALLILTALGALGGQGLVRLIPERWLRWLSALAFILLGVWTGMGTI